jgi:hypothetical protein
MVKKKITNSMEIIYHLSIPLIILKHLHSIVISLKGKKMQSFQKRIFRK